MTLKPFPNFKSLETHHCVTGSMRDIFEFNQRPVSEEMLLGLGAGVGFIYWHMKGTPPFMGGRANIGRPGKEGMEQIACRRLGVGIELIHTGSARKAEKGLLEFLEAGQPVMLQADMGFLPYFDFGGQEYHFGGHLVVAAGYDPETRDVLIADRDLELHPVPWDDLAAARSSTYKPFPPKNRLYRYDFSKFHPPGSAEVIMSIREVTAAMLEPPITNLGVKGIHKAAKQILKWHETMDIDALHWACFNCFIFIDYAGGTGGGLFRYMYGRYLKEAAEITGLSELNAAGDEFKTIGDHWQAVAEIFKRVSKNNDPATVLQETTAPMIALAGQERAVWEQLVEVVG
ncbi:MAG: BtrH N-terminal domain-containing protein [Anaerolineaceae bacterium]|nr:BtrH N-terminal domain-containing protein [Anaerolineaceae bacterium]